MYAPHVELGAPVSMTGSATATTEPGPDKLTVRRRGGSLVAYIGMFAAFMADFADFAGIFDGGLDEIVDSVRFDSLRRRLRPARTKAHWRRKAGR